MENGRCRLHGGLSTGPRTPEGRERSRIAHIRSGNFTKSAMEQRRLERLARKIVEREL
jgi:hypothetical protein